MGDTVTLQTGVGAVELDPLAVVNALVVLGVAYLVARATTLGLTFLAERSARRRITVKMFIPVTKFLVYGVAVYLVAGPLFQLSATQLLALSGLLGAALGFGLKDLFAGVIGGLVIILERPYQVGDKVTIGDHYGEVSDIGLRATTLTTPDDNAVRIPNGMLFTESVSNANDGRPEMLVVVEISVAPEADVAHARRIVRDALVTSPYVFVGDDHPTVVLVEDGTYYRTIRGKAYVADLREEFAFASDVTERTLAAFEAEGIATPDPRVPVHVDG